MKIQQHDGVVVEATVISAGLRQAQGDRGVSRRERERQGAWVRLPSLPPPYIGCLGGGAAKGVPCPPRQGWRPHP